MPFSRANPSPRYTGLVDLYRQMHLEGERFLNLPPQNVFPGGSLLPQAPRVKQLIARTGATSILDYGSGKGFQYGAPYKIEGTVYESIQDYWDVDFVHCFDPSYPPFSALPTGKFDGVVSTDVLEHCPEEDIEWIVDEIFSFANRFVFANVACYPAKKRLPTGENAHCTIKPVEWWAERVQSAAGRHPGVAWEFWIESLKEGPAGAKLIETRLTSEDRSA